MCNLNLFGDIFFVSPTGELGRGDCRPMAGQERDSYCMLNASQRGPTSAQDVFGSQRMVRRFTGLSSSHFSARRLPSVGPVSITICHVAVLRQRNHRTPTDFVNGPAGKKRNFHVISGARRRRRSATTTTATATTCPAAATDGCCCCCLSRSKSSSAEQPTDQSLFP